MTIARRNFGQKMHQAHTEAFEKDFVIFQFDKYKSTSNFCLSSLTPLGKDPLSLPEEVQVKIFGFIDPLHLIRVSTVSHYFYNFCFRLQVWQLHCESLIRQAVQLDVPRKKDAFSDRDKEKYLEFLSNKGNQVQNSRSTQQIMKLYSEIVEQLILMTKKRCVRYYDYSHSISGNGLWVSRKRFSDYETGIKKKIYSGLQFFPTKRTVLYYEVPDDHNTGTSLKVIGNFGVVYFHEQNEIKKSVPLNVNQTITIDLNWLNAQEMNITSNNDSTHS